MRRPTTRTTGIGTVGLCAAAALAVTVGVASAAPVGWSTYTVEAGAHSARVDHPAGVRGPLAGWIGDAGSSRTYDLVLTPTAEYVLTDPVEPNDQFDWNKLPGFSDCGDVDLSRNGAMFGWRWRTDIAPGVLELVPYANANGVHQYPSAAVVTLSHEDLAAEAPLRYSIVIDGAQYRFTVDGSVRGREIHESATLPRACPDTPPNAGKWYAGFYFGGTSTSPSRVQAYIREPAEVPGPDDATGPGIGGSAAALFGSLESGSS